MMLLTSGSKMKNEALRGECPENIGSKPQSVIPNNFKDIVDLDKLGSGLDESPTVMVVDNRKQKLDKNKGILKRSWAFVETNETHSSTHQKPKEDLKICSCFGTWCMLDAAFEGKTY